MSNGGKPEGSPAGSAALHAHAAPDQSRSTAGPALQTSVTRRFWFAALASAFLLMTLGLGLLWAIHWFRPERDLSKAVSVRIGYQMVGGQGRYLDISDPAEVQAVLASVNVVRKETGSRGNGSVPPDVRFTFADGSVVHTLFGGHLPPYHRLYLLDWGELYVLEDSFYRKLCEVLSKAEGRPIDFLGVN